MSTQSYHPADMPPGERAAWANGFEAGQSSKRFLVIDRDGKGAAAGDFWLYNTHNEAHKKLIDLPICHRTSLVGLTPE